MKTSMKGARPGGTQPPTSGRPLGQRVRILLAEGDAQAAGNLAAILRAQGWDVGWVRSGKEALNRACIDGPDAVLTELSLSDMGGAELCRALRGRSETAAVPIFVLSASSEVADRVACLRAGATDYLVKPPDPPDLVARLIAALDLRAVRSGFVVTALGGKGGVGTSLVAANLAVALRQETRKTVALFDAGWGSNLDVLLNLQARPGVLGLLARLDELEPADLDGMLTAHTSGVQALLVEPGAASDVGPEEMRKALGALRRSRDLVVVDAAAFPLDTLQMVVDLSDRLLLLLTPEITALRGARVLAQQAERLGLARERMAVVINRFPMRGGLQRRDVEGALGLPVQAEIPDDTALLAYSINRGVPVVVSHPRSGVARQVLALARWLAGDARLI